MTHFKKAVASESEWLMNLKIEADCLFL
jgi:hypothetical protein